MDLKDKFIKSVASYIDNKDELNSINKAFNLAINKLNGINCINGEPFINHIIRSATILTKLHSDYKCLVSELINWIPIYDKEFTNEKIIELFGEDVNNIIESLKKINKLKLKDTDEKDAIYLRKIMVGLSSDVRVILIKLAERLDNLKNVYTNPSEARQQKCIETENVLIPIAHRLGINYIKSELEDLCLRYLRPNEYNEILNKLDASREELNNSLDNMKDALSEMLIENNIKFRIKARVKSVHSIYDKLSKGKKWDKIYDILALRIIVEKVTDCYLIIGLIHSKYRPLQNRFKDYIAKPKENMYQSLHTGVIGDDGNIFEVQIRTEEMDEIAECGIASHWSYKEHNSKAIQNLMEQKLELFRNTMEANEGNDEDLKEEFKETFVSNMIYVYTPKGDVMELPEGSTPVDFAYRIHSHIGDTMIGAIVNDQIVPLDYKLQNDDLIRINTSKTSEPKKEWLNFVKTNQAKNKIKAYFSKQDREEYIDRGLKLLEREIKRRKLGLSETLSKENIDKLVNILKLKDYDELKLCIGSLRYTANYVLSLLTEDKHDVSDILLDRISTKTNIDKKNYKNDIIVSGTDDILVTIANCCKPIYGDNIVGYITKGNGVTVHKKDCSNIKNDTTRLIDVAWNFKADEKYQARILIKTNNINNNILDIVTKASQRNLSIDSINTIEKNNETNYELIVKVENTNKLNIFMEDLKNLSFVTGVERENK